MKKPSDLKALILDLDGVITSTAKIHAQAWKQMFDNFLMEYSQRNAIPFTAMDPISEYKLYVDGRPRYEGAQNFLLSRGIKLLFGSFDDGPGIETVCGLANKKNLIYLELLERQGAQVYEDTIETIKKWRIEQKKIAVISASKNCRMVLAKAGITDLFDVIVDGVDSQNYKLKGKPEPDIFLFAAYQLNVNQSEAAIVEDATAGVKAGKDGHFALVIGVSRNGSAELLYQNGADIVVTSLCDIPNSSKYLKRAPVLIPSALQKIDNIRADFKNEELLLLLDYDGTLTPIVARPELAVLSNEVRDVLRVISERVHVAVISGRDLSDIRRLVGLENIFYSGSHGFEIETPGGINMEMETAKQISPELNKAEQEATSRFSEIKGIIIDRKKFGLAIHYRLVDENLIERVRQIVDRIASHYDHLTIISGKKVFEFRPRIEWNKGKAVAWVAERLDQVRIGKNYSLYISVMILPMKMHSVK